jgi:hypothetical protein
MIVTPRLQNVMLAVEWVNLTLVFLAGNLFYHAASIDCRKTGDVPTALEGDCCGIFEVIP